MSIDKVREYLKEFNLNDRVMEFDSSSATVEEAAKILNCSNADIAKSLTFLVNEKVVMVVVEGDKRIDNSKFKSTFHCKAKMIPFDDVESLVGHAAGGVCPFAVNSGVEVYLDVSLKKHDVVYPACGSSSSAIKLTIPELELCSKYLDWVDVCKDE